ncbi:MAG: hypothetical protein SVZ03_01690 [Spirochaetota bacterium]|nr:hypothetical protein [Spirochaetota bacterium]
MKNINTIDPRDNFTFLDKKTANEPYIFEVLNEILAFQRQSLPSGEKPMANLELLKKSRNISIPFTTTRGKTIEYLIDLLFKRYSNFVKPVVSFEFQVEEPSKKLKVDEIVEYTVMLNNADYEKIVSIRDVKSLENLLKLLKKYRLFNLSKLLQKTKNKTHLSRIIKLELGKQIFVYKNYNINENKIEQAEDYCFCSENYNAVKESLNLNKLREIISYYSESVRRELKKFGLLNADFTHYRDSKIDYLFSILLDDLSTTLSEKDLIEVKNIRSLVSCLLKVDKILDPVQTHNEDIIKFIREQVFCSETDICNVITELNHELVKKWATEENLRHNRILSFFHDDGETYYIDGTKFYNVISELNQLILYQPEKLANLSHYEKQKKHFQMEVFYKLAINLLSTEEKIQSILSINYNKVDILQKIVEEYGDYKKKLAIKDDYEKKFTEQKKRRSILRVIIQFFSSLFKKKDKKIDKTLTHQTAKPVKEMSKEANHVYKKALNKNAPIIPLSDLIEITPENDALIDKIINELRDHNVKIVVPIYNARSVLYPKRSQNLLMSDMEYLLLSPSIVKSPEIIRNFVDSLLGYKVKNEIMPSKALIVIEKYLLTLYNQKRSQLIKK